MEQLPATKPILALLAPLILLAATLTGILFSQNPITMVLAFVAGVLVLLAPSAPLAGITALFLGELLILGTEATLNDEKLTLALYGAILLLFCMPGVLSLIRRHIGDLLVLMTLAVIALIVLGCWVGMSNGLALSESLREASNLATYSLILVCASFALSPKKLKRYLLSLLVILVGTSGVVALEYLQGRGVMEQSVVHYSDYIAPGDVGVLFGFFISLGLAVYNPRGATRWLLSGLAFTFVLFAYLTGTRSHLFSIIAGMAVFLWIGRKHKLNVRKRFTAGVIGIVLLSITVVIIMRSTSGTYNWDSLSKRYTSMLQGELSTDESVEARLRESKDALEAFYNRPILGQGLGYRHLLYERYGTKWKVTPLFMIHDFYLYLLVKFGMVGAAVFLVFLGTCWRMGKQAFQRLTDPVDRGFARGYIGLLAALLVESIGSSRFDDRTGAFLFSVFTGLLAARLFAQEESANAQGPSNSLKAPALESQSLEPSGLPQRLRPIFNTRSRLDRA